ncbi:MAG: hypothetical protein HPY89_09210 [Pelotomaculum sp.]|nr:hypothetical protein [Pelotomaculum sp.]
MAQIIIGSFKINCIHSGAVLNIGEVIFSLPGNKIELSAGSNSFCSGDGITSIASKERQVPDSEKNSHS